MIIRPAELGDAAEIAHIQINSYLSAYAGLLPQAYLDRFDPVEQQSDWEASLLASGAVLLVADPVEGGLAGYALGRLTEPPEDPPCGELVALHLRSEQQRRGIGRQLIRAMAQELAARRAKRLIVWVLLGNPASAFYRRLGGEQAGERSVQLDDEVRVREAAYVWRDIRLLCGRGAERPGST